MRLNTSRFNYSLRSEAAQFGGSLRYPEGIPQAYATASRSEMIYTDSRRDRLACASNMIRQHEAGQICHLSPRTLKRYRLANKLIEGIHYVKVNCRLVLYKEKELRQWCEEFGYNAEAQLKAIASAPKTKQ